MGVTHLPWPARGIGVFVADGGAYLSHLFRYALRCTFLHKLAGEPK
jgi:hypothetical protein